MMTFLPEYNGTSCDNSGAPMEKATGHFARGATGRVCLVMVTEFEGHKISTLDEIEDWAHSVPGGYLDY